MFKMIEKFLHLFFSIITTFKNGNADVSLKQAITILRFRIHIESMTFRETNTQIGRLFHTFLCSQLEVGSLGKILWT